MVNPTLPDRANIPESTRDQQATMKDVRKTIYSSSASSVSETIASSYAPSDIETGRKRSNQPKGNPLKRPFDETGLDKQLTADQRVPAPQTIQTYDMHSPTVSLLTQASPTDLTRIRPIHMDHRNIQTKSAELTHGALQAVSSKVDIIGDTVFWMMSKMLEKEGSTPELAVRLRHIRDTVAREPTTAFATLIQDLVDADEALLQSRDLNRDLAGTRNLLQRPCTKHSFSRKPHSRMGADATKRGSRCRI
jgi:hypothetical protein